MLPILAAFGANKRAGQLPINSQAPNKKPTFITFGPVVAVLVTAIEVPLRNNVGTLPLTTVPHRGKNAGGIKCGQGKTNWEVVFERYLGVAAAAGCATLSPKINQRRIGHERLQPG